MADRFKNIEEVENENEWVREVIGNFIYDYSDYDWANNTQMPMLVKLANYWYELGRKGE